MVKITRHKVKDKFIYRYLDLSIVTDKKILEWIDNLRIPPAWTQVQIDTTSTKQTCCGYDAANRLQCLYTLGHVTKARKKKYCELIEFVNQYPKIINDIKLKLNGSKFSKNRIIALILSIVNCCNVRLGTLKYETQNDSYGITTIRNHHVKFTSAGCNINFVGKKGVVNDCNLSDPLIIKTLQSLIKSNKPDDHVMMYQEGGEWFHIKHTDVNKYLQEYGNSITSKDFRTFNSNVRIIELLATDDPYKMTPNQRKKNLLQQVRIVAEEVHNTPAVCRKDYIDPEILALYLEHPISYRSKFITPIVAPRLRFIKWLLEKC